MLEKRPHDSSEGPEFVLFLPSGLACSGFLIIKCSEAIALDGTVCIELSSAKARLIRVMANAMENDAGLVPEVRGWRSHIQLGDLVGAETGWPLDVTTVRSYMSRIRRAIRKQMKRVAARGVPISLFEGRRNLGSRLMWPVRIEDATRPRPDRIP